LVPNNGKTRVGEKKRRLYNLKHTMKFVKNGGGSVMGFYGTHGNCNSHECHRDPDDETVVDVVTDWLEQ